MIILAAVCTAVIFSGRLRSYALAGVHALRGKKTVAERLDQYGAVVRKRLAPDFKRIQAAYPPDRITLVGIKKSKLLEVWVSNPPKLLKIYQIKGASGVLGPKLEEGDLQVPEGLYRIESLNPNSLYHLALRINYPNSFDKEKGAADKRRNLGGDIMIHGKQCSIGCLAMGDSAAEELFVLAADTGIDNISVILTPVDFRKEEMPADMPPAPGWAMDLYSSIKDELIKLRE